MNNLLLHTCCAGCGVFIAKTLKEESATTLFFYNPNIWPEEEYRRRLEEAERIAGVTGIKLIISPAGSYEQGHAAWLKEVRGHENDPERGERCRICIRLRLARAARYARDNKYDAFATTLTVSPHKDARAIIAIGRELSERYGVLFLERDFKQQDGFKRSCELARELKLYRQDYCGCEFSMRR